MKKNNIKIHKKHAFKTFDVLINMLRNKLPPFDIAKRPQDPEFLPKNLPLGGIEHALYLFYVCLYMRGRIKSHQAFQEFKKLYTNYPDFFDPKKIQADPMYYYESLVEQLKKGHLAFSVTDNARFWVENSRELYHGGWHGDPRNLFRDLNAKNRETPKAFKLVCSNIIRSKKSKKAINFKTPNFQMFIEKTDFKNPGFYGFLEKMVSMLSYYYVDANIIPSFLFPSPIDYHVSRFLIMQGIITAPEIKSGIATPKVLPAGRMITSQYCSKRNIPAVQLADVLWLYSQLRCNFDPNRSRFKKGKAEGRKTVISIAKEVKWTKSKMDHYHDSCNICPFNETCTGYVSEMPYYIAGTLKLVNKDRPLQGHLFSFSPRKKVEKLVSQKKELVISINKDINPTLFDEIK